MSRLKCQATAIGRVIISIALMAIIINTGIVALNVSINDAEDAIYNGSMQWIGNDSIGIPNASSADNMLPGDGFGILNVDPQPWPDGKWIPYMRPSWESIRDYMYDASPNAVDISSGGDSSSPIGSNDSVYVYYNNTSKMFFFRMLLNDNPWTGSEYRNYMWGVQIDTNGDGYTEWGSFLDGNFHPVDSIKVGYASILLPPHQSIDYFPYTQPADQSLGFTRTVYAGKAMDGRDMYYLDWQTPLSAFNVSTTNAPLPINASTEMRLFYGTATTSNMINKDTINGMLMTIDFSVIETVTPNGTSTGTFGKIYDIRDTAPPSNKGIWYYGETVRVNGSYWPINNSSIQNLSVFVLNPAGTIVSSANISYNTSTGIIAAQPIWSIPANGSVPVGVYSIAVRNPVNATQINVYDSFTVADNIPPAVWNVTAIPGKTSPSSIVSITANVTDNVGISSVVATLNGTNYTMTLVGGLYRNDTVIAPSSSGTFTVLITAYDTYGNVGTNSTNLTVIHQDPIVTKSIAWDDAGGAYNVTLNVTNPAPTPLMGMKVYDFIPTGFIAVVNNSTFPGPTTIITEAPPVYYGVPYIKRYYIKGGSPLYYSKALYTLGMDPTRCAIEDEGR